MEYTKDIILDVEYLEGENIKKERTCFNILINAIKKNKIISSIIAMTIVLMFIDFALVNSFINLLIKL